MATKPASINANPTAFFLNQPMDTSQETREKINEYVKRLVNLKSCILCKQDYDFTARIPRILVHCGHTICTLCLKNFHTNRKVRCPLCLKLIKNIDNLDRLPLNHTIFSKMMEERKDEFYRVSGKQRNFSDFTKHSILNRDKKERKIDSTIFPNPVTSTTTIFKPDPNAYPSKELFGSAKYETAEAKKQMYSEYVKNPGLETNLKNKLTDYHDLFAKDDLDEVEDVDGNILDKKFEIPEFDFEEGDDLN